MAGQGEEAANLPVGPHPEETVADRIHARFRTIETSLVEEINAVRQTGLADPRLVAICLTQLELAFLALNKALRVGAVPPGTPVG